MEKSKLVPEALLKRVPQARLSLFVLAVLSVALGLNSGCSSTQKVETQAYAKLNNQRTFEYDFPTVWKGIEEALHNYKIVDRSPKEVDPIEMKQLKKRTLETEWVYSQSRDKYVEFKLNG